MEQLELPYQVKLQVFEGPLDLLLQLIKKNKVELIYFSYLMRDFIKADKIKAIEDIADDF